MIAARFERRKRLDLAIDAVVALQKNPRGYIGHLWSRYALQEIEKKN